jgi:hypothetical protein
MRQRSQAEIEQLLESYSQRGGQTRRAFCEQEDITPSALDYYRRRYGQPGQARVRLKRVKIETESSVGNFSLILANGRRIECGEQALAQLIRIAETA